MKHDWITDPPYGCVFCQDSGMHDKAGYPQFCRCAAGVRLELRDPGAVARAKDVIERKVAGV